MTDQIPENAKALFPDPDEFLETVGKDATTLGKSLASIMGLRLSETDLMVLEAGVMCGASCAATELHRRGMLKAPGAES